MCLPEIPESIRAGRVGDTRAALFFGEVRLIIVGAVDGIVIQQTGDTAKADTPNVPSEPRQA